jgi:cytochrome c556
MRRFLLLLTGILLLLVSACSATDKAPAATAATAQPQPEFKPEATIKDIMDALVDPSADELWESVATTVDAKGMHERVPRTDEDWKNVRRSAIRLVEASNLLQIFPRHVAKPGEKSENPGIELEPEQMEVLVNQDRATFFQRAHALHDAAMVMMKAIDEKNAEALLDSGDQLDQACENCHLKYWYPNEAAAAAAQQSGAGTVKK